MATTKTSKTSTVKSKAADKVMAPKIVRKRSTPAHDEIARRAFERFIARGCQHGHDVDDWLAAEQELSA